MATQLPVFRANLFFGFENQDPKAFNCISVLNPNDFKKKKKDAEN